MPLIALDLQRGPASFTRSSSCLPEVCPDSEKSHFSQVIEPLLEPYLAWFLINHYQAQPNLRSGPQSLPYPTSIENP